MKCKVSRAGIVEIAKYTAGCLSSLAMKIAVTACFSMLGFPVWLAYLGAQLVILLFSYLFHSRITFRQELHGFREHLRSFLVFTGSVAIFKLADYLLVVLGAEYVTSLVEHNEALTPWMRQGIVYGMIVCSSGILFFIRFLCYRIIFRKPAAEEPQP